MCINFKVTPMRGGEPRQTRNSLDIFHIRGPPHFGIFYQSPLSSAESALLPDVTYDTPQSVFFPEGGLSVRVPHWNCMRQRNSLSAAPELAIDKCRSLGSEYVVITRRSLLRSRAAAKKRNPKDVLAPYGNGGRGASFTQCGSFPTLPLSFRRTYPSFTTVYLCRRRGGKGDEKSSCKSICWLPPPSPSPPPHIFYLQKGTCVHLR